MKILFTLATLLGAFAVLSAAKPHHGPPPHLKGAFETCMKQLDITKEQLHERRKNHEEKTEDCFDACVDKEVGIIAEDGSIDKEAAAKNFPPHVSAENVTKIVDACFEQKGANDCETSVLYHKCVMKLMPHPPMDPEAKKVHDSCKEKLSLNEEDLEKLHKARDDAKEDCFLACVGRGFGFVNEDGNLNAEKIFEKSPPHVTKEEVEKIVAECGSEKGANDCEFAILVHKCFEKNHFRPARHGPPPPPPKSD